MAERKFILSGFQTLEAVSEKLQKEEISFLVCELEDLNCYGIIVLEEDFERVCGICELDYRHYSLIETDQPNTFMVKFGLDIDPNDPRGALKLSYAKLVIGRTRTIVQETETKCKDLEQKIEKLAEEIHQISRQLIETKANRFHLEQYIADLTNQLLDDFDRLSKIPEVRSIEIKDGLMSVVTNPIIVHNNDLGDVNLGSYRIDISPQARSPLFYPTSDRQIRRIQNENYIHPLVPANNQFHMERFLPTFAQLMGEWNFSQVVMLCINILSNIPSETVPILRWWQK